MTAEEKAELQQLRRTVLGLSQYTQCAICDHEFGCGELVVQQAWIDWDGSIEPRWVHEKCFRLGRSA